MASKKAVLGLVDSVSQAETAVADLRRSGSTCAMRARRHSLTGRSTWAEARAAYARLPGTGRLPATVEVVYGHAWKAQPKKTTDGRAIVRFDPRQRSR